MPIFDINTEASIKLTVKLGRLHKSALPLAIRGTLNAAAFETKKNLPIEAAKISEFTTRSKTLFKAFSSVNKAKGFNINTMASEVGINSSKKSKLASGLGKQETGGSIQGRKLLAHDKGRVGSSHSGRVRSKNKFDKQDKYHDSTSTFRRHKGSKKSKYIASVMAAVKSGNNYMLLKNKKGKVDGFLYRLNVSSNIKSKKRKIKTELIYTYRNNKSTKLKRNLYIKSASLIAQKKIDRFYVKEGEKQIKRLLK